MIKTVQIKGSLIMYKTLRIQTCYKLLINKDLIVLRMSNSSK